MGNADLAEVALSLEALYGIRLGLKYDKLYKLSKLVEKLSGVQMPPHKPVVGDGAFRVESGIIAGWWARLEELKKPLIMFPYTWDLVGQKGVEMLLGKKSGRDSIVRKLKEMGQDFSNVDVDKILEEVKEESIKRKSPIPNEVFKEILKKYNLA
jgi:D-citramalate synthase